MLPLESVFGTVDDSEIFKLEQEVDLTLSLIAFDNKANDLKWISNRIRHLKRKYQNIFELYNTPIREDTSQLFFALNCVLDAYDGTVNPISNWREMSVEERKEHAYETLGECCFLGAEVIIPLSVRINRICKKNNIRPEEVEVYPNLLSDDILVKSKRR